MHGIWQNDSSINRLTINIDTEASGKLMLMRGNKVFLKILKIL
jgi:hypothetical protein